MVVKRIGPVSVAKIAAVLYAGIGLIVGIVVFLVTLVGVSIAPEANRFLGAAAGIFALILLPILYGCLGFVVSLIFAALFNVAARIAGGVQLDVE